MPGSMSPVRWVVRCSMVAAAALLLALPSQSAVASPLPERSTTHAPALADSWQMCQNRAQPYGGYLEAGRPTIITVVSRGGAVWTSDAPGTVIWFEGREIDRYETFDDFFLAMIEYNRREVAFMKTGSWRPV